MNTKTNRSSLYLLYALSVSGFLFSGYLSGTKFFTNTCAFGEACPLFLGHSACYFGFALFAVLFVSTCGLFFSKKTDHSFLSKTVLTASAAGTLFAGNFVAREILTYIASGFKWSALGFPTCAYGFIFFVLIFITGYQVHADQV